MKKIFTLFTFACTSLLTTNCLAQISESFETQPDFTALINECWTFNTVNHTNSAPIDGVGSIASQLKTVSQITPLPVKLISFQGNRNNSKVSLSWAVAENEINDYFEIEKSIDGKVFQTAGVVAATNKYGAESYSYSETVNTEKVYYRLKMFDNNQVMTYSKMLGFQINVAFNNNGVKIINSPTTDKLTLSFSSINNQPIEIKVYDLAGRLQMNLRINVYQGSNLISLPLSSSFKNGMYVVEINNGSERQIAKFVKQ